ncbi:MAG: ion transporter [Bauldia litoralis]
MPDTAADRGAAPSGDGGAARSRLARLRARVGAMMESRRATQIITGIIVFNAVTLGLETSDAVMREIGGLLHILDEAVLVAFVIELLLKLFAFGHRYFKNGWNLFDFTIIVISLMPASGELSVLRSLRIVRVLRLVAIVPAMRKVVQALMAAIPGVSSVAALLLLVYYVFSVMVTKLYGDAFPQWFGTVGNSMYSLFQIMTLESWSMGIVRPVMEKFPNAWAVFVPFILLTTFAVLNLFIAVVVNAMQEQSAADAELVAGEVHEATEQETAVLTDRLDRLQSQMEEIKTLLQQPRA